jgi:DNA-binding MarR family transcriptional regulator
MNDLAVDGSHMMVALLDAARAVEEKLETAMASVGLSTAKFGVLDVLAKSNDPLPLSELASRFGCVRSNITQLVDRLEADALVRRVADATDRRSTRAELTELGRERHALGEREAARVQSELSSALTADERAALAELLARVRPHR